MIIDARTVPAGTRIETDLCIIGSGPAGLTLAREFDGLPVRVTLLEAGGLMPEPEDQALYAGDSVGLPYERLDQSRSRYFGGSSNCWGGFCRPMDAHDFEVRDWVPNSGWPFGRAELLPWYRRAHGLLELGPFNYDPVYWEARLGRADARLVSFDRDRARNFIAQLSGPTRFGQMYRADIAASENVRALLGANVTEIDAPGNGSKVAGIEVRTRAGSAFRVEAQRYVLAAGGIETARLLLSSDRHQSCGVGNQNDVVGRYFMDHPRLQAGGIAFQDHAAFSHTYDMHYIFPGNMVADGTRLGAFFGLSPETQVAERIGNTRCYVKSQFAGNTPESFEALTLLYQVVKRTGSMRGRYLEMATKVVRNLPDVVMLGAGLKFRPSFLARGLALETIVEPTPLPESRVTLGSERDALGMRRVRLDWRLGELEKRTIRRTQEILAEEVGRVNAGTVTVDAPREGEPWPKVPSWCWHHMGTARMHNDPRRGVVDANCRVHTMDNLFIAGSSVFPTVGSDMPTITVVALALRLSAHLKSAFKAAALGISRETLQPAGVPVNAD